MVRNIVLVRPNYKSHIITPPIGLGYLSSYLKKQGFHVKIIDGLRDNLDEDFLLKKIFHEKPEAVGINCLTAYYNEAVSLCRRIKETNIGNIKGGKVKCIIGGVHPSFLPYETLKDSNADYVICGEGEIAFSKLLKNNFGNKRIKGVYSKKGLKNLKNLKDLKGKKKLIEIEKAEIIEDLDKLPFPDWGQINPNSYPMAPHGAFVKNFPIGVIITSRGCPYNCSFCASPNFYGRKIRFRSPNNVVKEIEYLVKHFGVKEIHFEDDNITLNRENIKKICELLIAKRIKIDWACPNGTRADTIDGELIKLMRESGCYYLSFGVESANPNILKNIKKSENIKTITNSINLADKAGLISQGYFVFGLPGETAQTIKETIDFAVNSRLSRAQFLILDVLPGSELWHSLSGKFKPNWKKNSYKEPEWIPPGLTKKQLMNAQSIAFRRFYARPEILFRLLRLIRFSQVKFLFKRLKDYRIIH